MARYLLHVQSNPSTPEQEDEFNAFYQDIHVPEVLGLSGFLTGTRYRLSDSQLGAPELPTYRYLAVYEIEADEPDAPIRAMVEAGPNMTRNPAIGAGGMSILVYEQIGQRQISDNPDN